MDGWGVNPVTVQAIGSIVAAVLAPSALIVAIRSVWFARKSAAAAQSSSDTVAKEYENRTRPWVGIVNCEYNESQEEDTLVIEFTNVGELPAENTTITAHFRINPAILNARGIEDNDVPVSTSSFFPWLDVRVTVFPNEKSYFRTVSRELNSWRTNNVPVTVTGQINYRLADKNYSTKFLVFLTFADAQLEYDPPQWVNVTGT